MIETFLDRNDQTEKDETKGAQTETVNTVMAHTEKANTETAQTETASANRTERKSPVPFLNNNCVGKMKLQINVSQTKPDEQLQNKAIFTKGSFQLVLPLSEWQPWRAWSRCSNTCGNGSKRRTRSCTNGPGCIGLNEDTETCILTQCPGEKANRYKYIFSFEYHVVLSFNSSSQKIDHTIFWIDAVWIYDVFSSSNFHNEGIFFNQLQFSSA